MKGRWIYIVLIIILTACVKEADWDEPRNDNNYIIVEGIITNEYRVQFIDLHYSKAGLNDAPVPVMGAEVVISNEDDVYQLVEDPEVEGRYNTDTVMVARFSKNYSLLIYHQDRFYSAQAHMVPGRTFPELAYKINEEEDLYHIDYVASLFEADHPAMWEIQIDWSSVTGYEDTDPELCKKRLLFFTLPTLDISQVFAPVVEKVSFPAGTKILERRYSLTPEHADHIRTLLMETSWQGGVFPSDPANVTTNLSDGAFGYFGICAVNALSLTVTAKKN